MKNKILILALMLAAVLPISAQTRHALLIGIGEYPHESGWSTIHGDSDVAMIKEYLVRYGFSTPNIRTLVNAAATSMAIKEEMEGLYKRSSRGDCVYVHFSGHGQQISDLDGDETDGYDEAWIPYDAGMKYIEGVYEGENHITDDYLNDFLTRLRVRLGDGGRIVVISDACHSGTGSRGRIRDLEEYPLRGVSEKFEIPAKRKNIIRKSNIVEWLFVGACMSFQNNREYKAPDGKRYGILSYAIANSDGDPRSVSFREMVRKWTDFVSDKSVFPQDVDAEGRPCRHVESLF